MGRRLGGPRDSVCGIGPDAILPRIRDDLGDGNQTTA
jgi:hypothetical protein